MTKSDLSRHMGYPRVKLHDDAACVEYEIAKRAYLTHIPQDRFSSRDVFPVPHHGDTICMVISLLWKQPERAVERFPGLRAIT